MVDTGFYLKDATISAQVYNGNTVPNDNTVIQVQNDSRKKTCNIQVNKPFKWGSQQDDPDGILEDYALIIYKRIVAGKPPLFSKEEKAELVLVFQADEGDNSPALITDVDSFVS